MKTNTSTGAALGRKVRHRKRRQGGCPPRNRHLAFEQQEPRLLLSTMRVAEMRSKLAPYLGDVQGATIITHGYQHELLGSGDSLLELAQAIRNRADAASGQGDPAQGDDHDAWLLDCKVTSQGGEEVFYREQSVTLGAPTEVVLLFDWKPESNEDTAGWGEAAGDALFSLIVDLGLVQPEAGTSVPLHFIGYVSGPHARRQPTDAAGSARPFAGGPGRGGRDPRRIGTREPSRASSIRPFRLGGQLQRCPDHGARGRCVRR